jgi:hypothetical protein
MISQKNHLLHQKSIHLCLAAISMPKSLHWRPFQIGPAPLGKAAAGEMSVSGLLVQMTLSYYIIQKDQYEANRSLSAVESTPSLF